ncbi:MAG: DUF4040 domain-containing protein [Cyanobacteria bacterium P01_D01_bin.156]
MTEDIYTVAILALLPVTAGMLLFQVNPYQALVIRGILGAIAALVYALFGAADVALTEALVGTMLSITLYAIAVRSSMSMRLGVIETDDRDVSSYEALLLSMRQHLKNKHLRLEVIKFSHPSALDSALANKDVHAVLVEPTSTLAAQSTSSSYLKIRVQRLYEILQTALSQQPVSLKLANVEQTNQVKGK